MQEDPKLVLLSSWLLSKETNRFILQIVRQMHAATGMACAFTNCVTFRRVSRDIGIRIVPDGDFRVWVLDGSGVLKSPKSTAAPPLLDEKHHLTPCVSVGFYHVDTIPERIGHW